MRIQSRKVSWHIFALVTAALAILTVPTIAVAKTPSKPKSHAIRNLLKSAKAFFDIVKAPNQELTLGRIRELAPSSISIGEPHWVEGDLASGNAVEMKGAILGLIVFLRDEQREALATGTDLTDEQTAFLETDTVAYIQIYVGDSVKQLSSKVANIISNGLVKVLGKLPQETPLTVSNPLEVTEAVGWIATWRFSNRRSVDLWRRWYGHTYVINIYFG
jgi:hypothetical protein